MTRAPRRLPVAPLAVALLLASAAGFAQTPTRDGNIWNGHDHQPTERQVEQREKTAGVAPTASEKAATAATENHLDRQLLNGAPDTPQPRRNDAFVDGSPGPDPNTP